MTRSLPLLAALMALPGCVIYSSGGGGGGGGADYAPYVDWADASCYWDRYYDDNVWWFEADVYDENGKGDIEAVYADVYDGWTGEWVDAFELYPDGGAVWFSAWQERSTYLDCAYYDYIVDFVAVDSSGEGEIYTLDLY